MITSIGGQLFSTVDKLAVGNVLGLSYVTYYSVGVTIANMLFQVASALTHSLMPVSSVMFSSGDKQEIRRLLLKMMCIIAVLIFLFAVLIFVVSKTFLRLWMGTDFMKQSISMFRILIIIYAIISLNAPAYHIANGIGAPWLNAVGGISGGILTICLIFILGNVYFLDGVAWANLGYFVVYITTFFLLIKLKYNENIKT